MPESLNNLRNIEKCDVDRMTFQSSHSILNDERVVVVCRRKIRYCSHWIYRSPVKKVLNELVFKREHGWILAVPLVGTIRQLAEMNPEASPMHQVHQAPFLESLGGASAVQKSHLTN